jgi:hypothetical protein
MPRPAGCGPVLAMLTEMKIHHVRTLRRLGFAVRGKDSVGKQASVLCLMLCLLLTASACSRGKSLLDREWSWSMLAETENQGLLFIDPGAVSYPDSTSVLVWVKYVPSKSRAVAGMRELSKEFGGGVKQNEYTISQWHFSCVNASTRCVRLIHYRDKIQIASYSYPSGDWTGPPKGDTRIVFDTACAMWSKAKR